MLRIIGTQADEKQQQAVQELDIEHRNKEEAQQQQQLAGLREELANQTAQLATTSEAVPPEALEAVQQMTQTMNGTRADLETKVHTSSQQLDAVLLCVTSVLQLSASVARRSKQTRPGLTIAKGRLRYWHNSSSIAVR